MIYAIGLGLISATLCAVALRQYFGRTIDRMKP